MIGHFIGAAVCAIVGTYLVNIGCRNMSWSDTLAGLLFFLAGYMLVVQTHGG